MKSSKHHGAGETHNQPVSLFSLNSAFCNDNFVLCFSVSQRTIIYVNSFNPQNEVGTVVIPA